MSHIPNQTVSPKVDDQTDNNNVYTNDCMLQIANIFMTKSASIAFPVQWVTRHKRSWFPLCRRPWSKFFFQNMLHRDKHTPRLPARCWNVYTCKKYLFNWELQMESHFLLVFALVASWQTNTPCRVTAGTTFFHRNARFSLLFVSSSREEIPDGHMGGRLCKVKFREPRVALYYACSWQWFIWTTRLFSY